MTGASPIKMMMIMMMMMMMMMMIISMSFYSAQGTKMYSGKFQAHKKLEVIQQKMKNNLLV